MSVPKRQWVTRSEGDVDWIWCADNGGPEDCEYRAVRPAAMGSHQSYKHDGTTRGRLTVVPPEEGSTGHQAEVDVVGLMDRMARELRRLWPIEEEYSRLVAESAQQRQALTLIRKRAEELQADNTELLAKGRARPRVYTTTTGDRRAPSNPVLSESEVRRLMGAPKGGAH